MLDVTPSTTLKELRDDQMEALQALRQKIAAGHRRVCMQAPTGFGKTVLASAIVRGALSRNKRVLFTVPALGLIDQTVEMFRSQGITEVGVIQATHELSHWDMPVQIASVQTLMKRKMWPADLVLVDEVHRLFQIYTQWFSEVDGWQCPVIGLSATPWTKGLGKLFQGPWKVPAAEREPCLIVATTTEDLIEQGRLSPFKVFAPSHPDMTGVRTVAGDYHEGDTSKVMQGGALVADAVQTWLEKAEGRPTLCYAVDRAHAKLLQRRFLEAGIPTGYQDAFTGDETKITKEGIEVEGRRSIREKFASGAYPVVVNVGTLTTGIDWDVRCISMCRPTKSDMLFVQIIGRGLRTAPGKDHCLILDHSDNHTRLGFVTEIDQSYTGLDCGAEKSANRTDRITLPKECPQCTFLRPPKVATCPNCGFTAKAVSKQEVLEGELRELKPKPKVRRSDGWPNPDDMAEKLQFLAELRCYGAQRSYKSGWASNKYRERLGVWPAREVAPAAFVSDATLDYIEESKKAWIREKRRSESRAWGSNGPHAEKWRGA